MSLPSETPAVTEFPVSTMASVELPGATELSDFAIGSTSVSEKDDMVLVYVPAGDFTMGGDDGSEDEKPQHRVYLDAFWIDQTEVTNAMYAKCVQAEVCELPTDTNYYNNLSYADHPVVFVTWGMANAYRAWSERKLPLEDEWNV